MPSEVPTKVGGPPLPSVTPPRLMSPAKSRLTKESLSKLSEPMTPDELMTQATDVTDGQRSSDDITLSERDPVSSFV